MAASEPVVETQPKKTSKKTAEKTAEKTVEKTAEKEEVKVSKLFGKITKRPTKQQYAEELLEGDMKNLGRAITGDEKNEGDLKEREKHLARMIADYKKICYTDAQLTKVRKQME